MARASSSASLVPLRGEAGVIEAERVGEQQPRVELRRVEAAAAKLERQLAPRVGHRGTRRETGRHGGHAAPSAASSAAWCSVTSASMISPSASPSITCGSL